MAREKIKRPPRLTDGQAERYRQEIGSLAAQNISAETLREQYREYLPDKPLGRAICESYPKEDLTLVLKGYADELGHAPAQHEVFPLYRAYIKRRFGTWPAALREAGLRHGLNPCRREIAWEQLLREEPEIGISLVKLAERMRTLGHPPVRKEIPDGDLLKQRFGEWNLALSAAESLDIWLEEHPTPLIPAGAAELSRLTALAEKIGRTPLNMEASEEDRVALRLGYGSWNEALHAAGLAPLSSEEAERARWEYRQRSRAGSCALYRVKTPTQRQRALLDELRALCDQYGRAPLRDETPRRLRDELVREFSSWRNALFQLREAPVSTEEERRIKRARNKREPDKKETKPER